MWRRLTGLKPTLADLKEIVASNDKQRYQLILNPALSPRQGDSTPSTDPGSYLIRAVQGHSLPGLDRDKVMTRLTTTDYAGPILVVHGTIPDNWQKIQKSGGLKPMTRSDIHFATREPGKSGDAWEGPGKVQEIRGGEKDEVLSGMRKGSTILIWVDVKRSMEAGVKWWRSYNDVYLTDGVEVETSNGETERLLLMEWVRWVERRGTKEVLWKNEGADIEAEKLANQMQKMKMKTAEAQADEVEKQKGKKEVKAANGVSQEKAVIDTGKGEGVKVNGRVKESWDE